MVLLLLLCSCLLTLCQAKALLIEAAGTAGDVHEAGEVSEKVSADVGPHVGHYQDISPQDYGLFINLIKGFMGIFPKKDLVI